MKNFYLCITLWACSLYGQDNAAERIYNALRALHAGEKAAPAFTARLSSASARRLLKDKLPGTNWYVSVDYSLHTGLTLKVLGSENFYENSLAQYETHINEMLMPLLANRGYERFKKSFVYTLPKPGIIGVSFKKGDVQVGYFFQTGENGLVRRLDYHEDGGRKYALAVQWEDAGKYAVPKAIKAVSYEGSRISGDFELEKIKIIEK